MTSFFMFPAFSCQIIYTVRCIRVYVCYDCIVAKLYTDIHPKLFFVFSVFFIILTLHLVTSS